MTIYWHRYPLSDVLKYASWSAGSGLRTAQAIEDSLARMAAVIRNDYRPQSLEVLRQNYRIFQGGRFKPDSILIDGVPNKNNPFPDKDKEWVIEKEFTKHVNAIKAKSKESSDPPTKEELKHDKKNNKFELPCGTKLSYQLKKKQRLEDHEYLNDCLYVELGVNLVQTLITIVVALRYFCSDMDEHDHNKVVFFKKHNEIFDNILKHVKTILKYSRKLSKKTEQHPD